jgi:osmoprotectant transport system permease protein
VNAISGVSHWLTDGAHWRGSDGVPVRVAQHLELSALSLLVVVAVALPVALWLGHIRRGGFLAVNITNVGRAIPTFAVLTLLTLTKLGISDTTVVVSLVLFGLPPALTNAYVGVREVDPEVVEAAKGMGMSGFQQLRRVELPLAMPLVVNGIRLAAVQIVATMTIASLVAGPGLGRIITEGFATQNRPELESGALIVVVLALLVEVSFAWLQRTLDPVRRAHRVTNSSPPPTPELLDAGAPGAAQGVTVS